jgi:hypothetical protein
MSSDKMRLLLRAAFLFCIFAAAMALFRLIGVANGSGMGHILFIWDVPPWAEGVDAAWRIALWSFWAVVAHRRLRALPR